MFLDFDGTLAPIVEEPSEARPLDGTAAVLARLAETYSRVAVISGRPVAYLVEMLAGAGAGGTEFVGLYGMQRCRRGHGGELDIVETAEALPWRAALEDAAAAAEAGAPVGVTVERKGLAVTIHYRRAPEHAGWAQRFAQDAARRTGLAVHPGKMSAELRPPVSTDKGTVLEELAEGKRAVFFAGDDIGDVPAFRAMQAMRARGIATLSVAVAGAETPAEVTSAADLVVDGPEGVLGILEELAPPTRSGR